MGTESCSTFPCCMGLPLEMGVQFIGVFDIVTSFLCLVTYCTVYVLDLFAPKKLGPDGTQITIAESDDKSKADNTKQKFNPPFLQELVFPAYKEYVTTTTTTKAPWTLRTTSTKVPLFGTEVDTQTISKTYAKISNITYARHDIIQKRCKRKHQTTGDDDSQKDREYVSIYLFGYGLDQTSDLWTEFLSYHIAAEVIYIILACLMLLIACCFVEHRGAKVLIMIVWWLEWVAIYLKLLASVISQSARLCIIEWGFAIRGQTVILIATLLRIGIFKLYELLLVAVYISQLLDQGYLKNETLDQQAESKPVKNFYKQLYAMEEQKGNDPLGLMSRDTSYAIGFQDIHPSKVDKIQGIMEAEPISSVPDKKPHKADN